MAHCAPDLDDVARLRATLEGDIVTTPMIRCAGIEDALDDGTTVFGKLEFLQRTGTFKARGALTAIKSLQPRDRASGVTAVSAGNHAIAVAYAARACGTSAKVVMIAGANPTRIEACRSYGAEIVMADDAHSAFERVEQIREQDGRFLVHPFEGEAVARGTGTLGLEICEQCPDADAVVVAIGGGGLIGGIANVVKQRYPGCQVIGVEAEGADSMNRSLRAGQPVALERVDTIADSLGAPFALPYSYALCESFVDRIVLISDNDMRRAMGRLFTEMRIAVEPACAASTAALYGPLRQSLAGKRIVLVFCGSNIDWPTFSSQAVFE